MKITDIKFTPCNSNNLKAFAQVTFDDTLKLTGVKILNGTKGLFVGFPSRKGKDENYYDIVYPVTAEAREEICDEILKRYNKQDNAVEEDDDDDLPF